MRAELENAAWYGWKEFERWADEEAISDECEDDRRDWWECWKGGFCADMNE
jgi:hypothetical protein